MGRAGASRAVFHSWNPQTAKCKGRGCAGECECWRTGLALLLRRRREEKRGAAVPAVPCSSSRPGGLPVSAVTTTARRAMLPCHAPKWLLAPLCLLLAELEATSPPTYQWKDAATDTKVTCEQCPPGTFVAQHCSSSRRTRCEPCPDLHYTQYWNYLERCRYCNVICEEKQVEVQQCNATHNRVCQCREGYFAEDEFCVRHSECPPGSGVVSAGTPVEDTRCQPCPRGSFSSSTSSQEPCRPHQDCARQGKATNVPGNQYHDTLCTACGTAGGNATRAPASADEDCTQAAIDFVSYQDIPVRKLKRLQQLLAHNPRRPAPGGRAALQEKIWTLLTLRKEGHHEVTQELLGALRAAKLHAIEEQVRERFLAH